MFVPLRYLLFSALCLSADLLFAQVTIDPPSRSFSRDGGAGAILTLGSGAWTGQTSDDWITITPRTTGNAGQSCIYVIDSNFSADTRTGEIDINGNIHVVSQSGYSATLSPTSASANLDGGEGAVSVSVDAGVSWSVSSNADWITAQPASGISSGTVNYTVDPNPGITTRNGSLIIAGQTFVVTQTGTDVNISPKSVAKAYSSDIIQVQVTALVGTSWSVTPNASWISVVDDGNGFGDSTITLAVGTNPSYLERTATVSIGSATLSIKQAGTPNLALDIIPDEATADPRGAFGSAAILATPDAPWFAVSEEPWIVIAEGSSGAGNGNINYVVSANPNLEPRTGRIRVLPPVVDPSVNLSKQLFCHIKSTGAAVGGSQDLSGWNRDPTSSLSREFDGSFSVQLVGQDFFRNDDAFSLACWFTLREVDAINRLIGVERGAGSHSGLYVDASNRLVFASAGETLVTDLIVEADAQYQVLVATETNGLTTVYAGKRDGSIANVGSLTFSQAPFPSDYVVPAKIDVGRASLPSAGNLTDASIDDFRVYGRALNADEAEALFEYAGTTEPYGIITHTGDPANTLFEYELQGQAIISEEGGSRDEPSWHSTITWNREFPGGPSREFLSPKFVEGVTGTAYGAISALGWGVWWSYRFNYTDGSSAVSEEGFHKGQSNSAQFLANPFPSKPVNSIDLLARNVQWGNYPYKIIGSQVRYSNPRSQELRDWHPSLDRYEKSQLALESDGSGRLELFDHSSSFSNPSATYNFWLRVDQIAEGRLFVREVVGEGLLICSLNSNGNIQLGGEFFPADLVAGEWHMLTIAAAHGANTKIYLDGQEIGNTTNLNAYHFGSSPVMTHLLIGGWDGAIDYVGFYEDALSSGQIATLYDAQKFELQYHTVTQGVVTASLSSSDSTAPASGGSGSFALTLANNVNWVSDSSAAWITLNTETSGIGSTTVSFDIAANPSVYERSGTVTIAGEAHTITQAGLNATLASGGLVFGTDGGSTSVDVFPESNGSWEAVSESSWLTVAVGQTGTGPGSVLLVADPYTQTSLSRTGIVNIAGQALYFTQRGYQLSVSPEIAQVGSNAGAGEFGVAAPLSAVWEAITTADWITITGSSTGIGDGTLRYSVSENITGAPRTGRIIVSGVEYTISQEIGLQVSVIAGTGGSVVGSGDYETNATAMITASSEDGYAFSHWTGDAVGSDNPLELIVDSNKNVVANFIPESAVAQFQQPILAQIQEKDEVIEQKNTQLQANTLTIEDLQNGINTFAAANVALQASYDNAIAERDARFVDSDEDGITDVKEVELETDPQEVTAFYLEASDPTAIEAARLAGRSEVLNAPQSFDLYTSTQYNSIVAQRDARPTQAAYDAIVLQRDARFVDSDEDGITDVKEVELGTNTTGTTLFYLQTAYDDARTQAQQSGKDHVVNNPALYNLYTTAQYAAMVAERDARPTQLAYNAVIAQRDARPTAQELNQAVSDATTSGREQVTSNPSLYNLYTTAQYAAVIAERNARPTQDAYDAVIAQRDARPTLEEVKDARLGSVLLLPNAATNKVKLRFTIEESNELGTWTSRQEEAEVDIPLDPGKRFFRFSVKEDK